MLRQKRNSNIETLRIIAMFFIVAGHFVGQSGSIQYNLTVNDYLVALLSSGSRVAVNIFLLIGVWFMTDSLFKASRVLKLYGQVAVYSIPITLITLLVDPGPVSLKDTARGLMPFLGRGLWFVSAYITLMFFKPFLDEILKWEKKRLRAFVAILMVFVPFVCTLPDKQESYVLDSIWFLVAYLTVGYLKKYPLNIKIRSRQKLVGGGTIYLLLTSCSFLAQSIPNGNALLKGLGILSRQYLSDIKTIPNLLCAGLIVSAFINMKPRSNKVINYVSSATLSLYIIHQVPVFYPILWRTVFNSERWVLTHRFSYIFVVFGSLLISAIILDWLRTKFLEPLWVNSKLYRKAEALIDRIYLQ